jgi:hypothetical protein
MYSLTLPQDYIRLSLKAVSLGSWHKQLETTPKLRLLFHWCPSSPAAASPTEPKMWLKPK